MKYDEAVERGMRKMALKMYNDGDSIERIAKLADETVETIQEWLDEMDD